MDVISGAINGKYLRHYLEESIDRTEYVKAAVAYANGHPELFDFCWKNKIPLTFYGRYDLDVPISTAILDSFLKRASGNYVCKLIPDIFHPKVIWWYGYGAYIGSANLTNAAWYGNIEVGMFFHQDELDSNGITNQLDALFDFLEENSYPLSDEVYREQCTLEERKHQTAKQQENQSKEFEKKRKLPRREGLRDLTTQSAQKKQKQAFLKEWYSTLQILRNIATKVSDDKFRPNWIDPVTPKGAQADQFLHAYYYEFVKEGQRAIHREMHDKNRNNTEAAVLAALKWWKGQDLAPHDEDSNLAGAEVIRSKLGDHKKLYISEEDFIDICQNVHALRDHCLRVRNVTLGLPEATYTPQEERIILLSKWLYQQKNPFGRSILDTIEYVLNGGSRDATPDRIFDATHDEKWMIPHFGISSVGEMVGWALPDHFPPRNGRTSKALFALGYEVKIYSE